MQREELVALLPTDRPAGRGRHGDPVPLRARRRPAL